MNYTDLQPLFKDRLEEIFHKDSLDSYRVSCHNGLSLLKELRMLVQRWGESKIKHVETVLACLEECEFALINEDYLDFSFCGAGRKDAFIEQFKEFKNAVSNAKEKILLSKSFVFYLNKCIDCNQEVFLDRLFLEIESVIFEEGEFEEKDFIPVVDRLDKLIRSLSCELIHRGFSKVFLFRQSQELDVENFRETYMQFKECVHRNSKNYIVIFKLNVPERKIALFPETEFVREVNEEYKKGDGRSLTSGKSVRFYECTVNSSDMYGAVKKGREKLSSVLDAYHIGLFGVEIKIPQSAVVVERNGELIHVVSKKTDYMLDGNYVDNPALSDFIGKSISKIKKSDSISKDVKDRLEAAIRHLRIGNVDPEIEQRFLNYWIALEYVFSSAYASESTFSRLKENLTNVLTSCYVKRNSVALLKELKRKGYIDKGIDDLKIYSSFKDFNRMSLLDRYRVQKIKSHLNSRENIKGYILNHQKRVTWQIVRIYRLRNELIHEAAITQDIENVTSNLRYYLVMLLNQMIKFFSENIDKGNKLDMDDFFLEFRLMSKIMKKSDIDDLLNFPVEVEMLI